MEYLYLYLIIMSTNTIFVCAHLYSDLKKVCNRTDTYSMGN